MRRDWHRLVSQLKDRGITSPHLERLKAHLSAEEQDTVLEQEIRSEIASALGRAEAKVIAALLALQLADADIDDAVAPEDIEAALTQREMRRQEALSARASARKPSSSSRVGMAGSAGVSAHDEGSRGIAETAARGEGGPAEPAPEKTSHERVSRAEHVIDLDRRGADTRRRPRSPALAPRTRRTPARRA